VSSFSPGSDGTSPASSRPARAAAIAPWASPQQAAAEPRGGDRAGEPLRVRPRLVGAHHGDGALAVLLALLADLDHGLAL
jgi:hypothetical protein